jgi:hypothetical protein
LVKAVIPLSKSKTKVTSVPVVPAGPKVNSLEPEYSTPSLVTLQVIVFLL